MPLKPLRPKVIATIMKGMTSTPNMWMRPTMAEFSATVLSPASVRAAPPLMVVRPAPPQEHGVASPSRARAMDVMGSKPSATRNGAAIAAGAPAPAAPSRKMGSIIPMMTTCTRRSSLMRAMVPLTSSIAPVARSRFRITKAPNTISTIFSPSLMPFHSRASYTATFSLNVAPVTLKYVKASTSVQISATGATRLADWRNPRIPTNTTMIGLSAITKFRKPMVAFSLSMHKCNAQRSGHTRPACRWGPRRPCAGRTQEVAFIKKEAPPDGGASCLICLSLAFQKRRQIGERCTAVRLPVIRSSSRTKMDASRAAPRIMIMQLFIAAQAKAAQVSCADAAVFMVMAVVIAAHFLSLNVEGSIA